MPRDVKSTAQLLHRASFKLIVDAYDSFGGITDKGFPGRPRTYSPYNAFMKANMSSAIDKSSGIPVIDYSKLVVSEGSLPVVDVTGSVTPAGISISYETDTEMAKVLPSDQMVAFFMTKKGSLRIVRQARGSDALGTILIPSPGITAADVVCCYVFALNADGTKASNSVYVAVV